VSLTIHHLAPFRRRLGPVVLAAGLISGAFAGAAPVSAAAVCNPGGDVCVVYPDSVQTPLGLVSVTASVANVVTVHLDPSAPNTLVFGVPFSFPAGPQCMVPPGPPCVPGYARTTIATSGGLVTIDTIQSPPGPPNRFSIPSLAIISIHPPSPCRARTSGTTVVFTPIFLPGPPA
jgi:hypothetical protein